MEISFLLLFLCHKERNKMKLLNHKKYNKTSGIYLIRNTINNKVYIGSSKRIYSRISWHLNALNNNYHHNNHLQKSWNKYGKNNFKVEILEVCEDLLEKETYYISIYKSDNREFGYNLTTSKNGRHIVSEETKRKLSEKMKGRTPYKAIQKQRENFLNGIPHHSLGIKHTKEHVDKVIFSRTLWTEEQKQRNLNINIETLRKYRWDPSKKCIVKNLNGDILDEFSSIKKCHRKYNHWSYSQLLKIFRGEQKNNFYKDLLFCYSN